MSLFFKFILVLLPLSAIFYEDLKGRAYHVFWLLILSIGILTLYPISMKSGITNLIFVSSQLLILTIWLSFKNRKVVNIIDNYFGLGDLLICLPLACVLLPLEFFLFWLISISLSLCGYVFFKFVVRRKVETIPLAGCMSLFLIIVFTLEEFYKYNFLEKCCLLLLKTIS